MTTKYLGVTLETDQMGLVRIVHKDGSKSLPFPNMTRAKDAVREQKGTN